ncbi:MAG: helix-turn-helix domain-containing protein [Ilumatobacteraceae bacterium]
MTETNGRRGEYAKSEQRRRDIIAAAVEVFSESGYRDGALRDVADRAGITHAAIRYHFPTKVDLLEAVLRWRDDRALAVGSANHPDGIGVLRAWLAEIRHNRETPGLVTLEMTLSAEASTPDHPAYEHFSRHDRIAIKLLQRAFSQIRDEGHLVDSCTPADAAQIVAGATLGLQALWIRNRSVDVADELRRLMHLLVTVEIETEQR